MTYLTSPEAGTSPSQYRYYVELASVQLDCDGIPEFWRMIDLVVAEPTKEAIESAIVECEWLKGYSLVSFWQPQLDSAPF